MILHPTLPARVAALSERFAAARPFRHVVIDDFFDEAFAAALAREFPAFDAAYALNESGEVGGKAVRQDVRDLGAHYRALDDAVQAQPFLDLVSEITAIPDLHYDPWYVGGGTHENRPGQRLEPHVDFNHHPVTREHRRLNLIVYLNERWEPGWGGCIELHSDPWAPERNEITRVVPHMNRAVLFETTETSWHGFETIRPPAGEEVSRKSFALYLYTAERPAAESAPDHATVYVPLRIPGSLAAGHTLDAGEVTELREMIMAGLGQLRFLYDREKFFAERLDQLDRALAEARGHVALPLSGHLRQAGPGRGFWPDGWAGAELEFPLRADQDLARLEFEVFVPPEHGQEFTLAVSFGDGQRRLSLAPGRRHQFPLPARLAAGGESTLRLESSGSWRPCDHGGADERELAFRLERIIAR